MKSKSILFQVFKVSSTTVHSFWKLDKLESQNTISFLSHSNSSHKKMKSLKKFIFWIL